MVQGAKHTQAAKRSQNAKHKNDPFKHAVNAATSVLLEQMRALNATAQTALEVWEHSRTNPGAKGTGSLDYYLDAALKLAEVSAKLGETLSKMRTETRQRISVERVAAPAKPARIAETQFTRAALKARRNSDRYPRIEGEGGVADSATGNPGSTR